MAHAIRTGGWLIGLAVAAGLIALSVFIARPTDPQKLVERMQTQIARIRGLPFKRSVVVHEQSQDEFRKYAQAQLQQLSDPKREQVLRTLGLLAADETLNIDAVRKRLTSPGALGHYDPQSGRLLLVKSEYPQVTARDDLYARELHRALLDQHFDLKVYLDRHQRGGSLSDDELLARQLVVEGEAFYAAVLWRVQQKMGRIPDYLPLKEVMDRTSTARDAIGVLSDPRMRGATAIGRAPVSREPGSLPTYLSQLSDGVLREAVLFIDAVRRGRGRSDLDYLYTTSPPASTEQVLHPEKWVARELPLTIKWPAFETNKAFADWELVEQGVMGELLWRVVFRVHRLSPMMDTAPAGWNGDRYAVFERRGNTGDMLLLAYTAWDTEAQATSFAQTYRVLVKEKYVGESRPVRILEEGHRVLIVEGGAESSLDAFMRFAQSAQEVEEIIAVEK